MYSTTGFSRDQIVDLCAMIHERVTEEDRTWPPILGLFKSVTVALAYLRRNRVQQELAEAHSVSQPTISRAVSAVTAMLSLVLTEYVPSADDLDEGTQLLVDGTLLPCWSWAAHPELYSGKHKTTGMNVQVACTLDGRLAWISDPIPGSRHDSYCLTDSGALDRLNPADWIGDKGYVGKGMLTPIRKPECRDLLEWEKLFNTQINRIRYLIEQVIAHLKNWRILHTDYRRPLPTFTQTISAVVALHFFKLASE